MCVNLPALHILPRYEEVQIASLYYIARSYLLITIFCHLSATFLTRLNPGRNKSEALSICPQIQYSGNRLFCPEFSSSQSHTYAIGTDRPELKLNTFLVAAD